MGDMELVTVKELSAYLKVKAGTIYYWVNSGAIPFYKLNGLLRFDMREVGDWVKSARKGSRGASKDDIRPKSGADIDSLVKNVVESVTGNGYNRSKRETRPKSRSQEGGSDGTL